MKRKMRRRVGGIVLASTMLISTIPATALAADESSVDLVDINPSSNDADTLVVTNVNEATTNNTLDAADMNGEPDTRDADSTNWIDEANTDWYTSNSEASEFTITSTAELAGLAKLVNGGNDFSKKTIKLGANIDLAGKEWTPIGKSGKPFIGIFDGQGKTISNLVIDMSSKSDVGLFGYTSNGEIKNFTLNNAKVVGDLDVGAVAGTPYTSKYTNISVTGLIQVEGFSYVGGALGKNAYANVTNVDVIGSEGSYVKAESGYYRTYLGGLIGFMGEGSHTVSDCDVEIDVTGSTCNVGGILGILHYNNTMENCTYKGNLTLTDPDAEDGTEFGALTGTVMNSTGKVTITDCSATVIKAMSGDKDVTNTITAHGDFYHSLTDPENATGEVSVSATVNGNIVTVNNNVATVGTEGYTSLASAIAAANDETGANPITVEIVASGSYAPFTITRDNVTVQAAEGVDATFNISADSTGNINGEHVTLKGLDFVSTDGTTIFSSGDCDDLTLEGCTFTGDETGTALYIHKPNITITGCTFKDFERGYYTCGDNHAAGAMTFTNNIFTNVRVPIDGYWGKTATATTNIKITGNTFDNGDWDAAYIQLWDYAQYLKWAGNKDDDRQGSAIKATISDNTYAGNVVIYATHFDWFTPSELTLDEASTALVKHRYLVELENADSATVRNADGSEITTFNDSTTSSTHNGKTVIYSICEGDYIFDIKPTESTEAVLSQRVTVSKPSALGNTNKITISDEANKVAQVGEQKYTSLAEAIDAAMNGTNKTITLLSDIAVDSWNMIWNITGITLDGDGHTIKVNDIQSGQNHDAVFHSAGNNIFKNLTVDLSGIATGSQAQGYRAFSAAPGDVFEEITVIGNGHVSYGITVGGSDAADETITIDGCTFNDLGYAVYDSENANVENLIIKNSTMTNCDYATILCSENGQFIDNAISGGKLNIMTDKQTVTGNVFTDGSCIKFYAQPAAFEKNNISSDSKLAANSGVTGIDVSENYWGGGAPSADQLNGVDVTGNDVYYTADTMNPEDLNTYRPSSGGGAYHPDAGSGSSSDHYDIDKPSKVENGSIKVSDSRAEKGDTVTITVTPDEGYELDELVVYDEDGDEIDLKDKGDGKFTFEMPKGDVEIEVSFAAISDETPKADFVDVPADAWYAEAVQYVYENGMMSGTSETTFSPNLTTTRGMIVTILYRLENEPTVTGTTAFTDVAADQYYANAVAWAAQNGIVSGTTATTFAPNKAITREQMAAILYRYAQFKGYDVSAKADLSVYTDAASVGAYAVDAMAWANGAGLITGTSATTLTPAGNATRAQVATILMRFCENIAK